MTFSPLESWLLLACYLAVLVVGGWAYARLEPREPGPREVGPGSAHLSLFDQDEDFNEWEAELHV